VTSPRGRASLWFVVVAGVMLAVLSWLTVALLDLDEGERVARRQSALHERLRLALWRMDSWLSPQLARETMRPPGDYRAFPSASNAWTQGFRKIGPDEVIVQSPLLGAESPLFVLHFEVRGDDVLRSPQAPLGNERDFAEANGIASEVLERARSQLTELQGALPCDVLRRKVGVLAQAGMVSCEIVPDSPQVVQQSVNEFNNRRRAVVDNVNNDGNFYANPGSNLIAADEVIGAMVPVWIDAPTPRLLFARQVSRNGVASVQAVLVDWLRLQHELLRLVQDLFVDCDARIERCEDPTAEEQLSMLASVPARLVVDMHRPLADSELPVSVILWTTWGVTLLGLFVLGFTLRTAIGFGERRARFASAVTHELRTPLTTFRMYSEMLAEGVVTDPVAQKEYLQTLQSESDRLARVVENVLAWSRLEEGRFTSRRERIAVHAMVERLAPTLEQRLGEVGMSLDVRVDERAREAVVVTDEDAVGQVLFNLIDNAAKYARGAEDRSVRLTACRDGDRVRLRVCDHGPGVDAAHRERVFVPFDRGAVPGGSNDLPGVGLGLPLARGLARDLGGDLRLEANPGGGACFVLELPLA